MARAVKCQSLVKIPYIPEFLRTHRTQFLCADALQIAHILQRNKKVSLCRPAQSTIGLLNLEFLLHAHIILAIMHEADF